MRGELLLPVMAHAHVRGWPVPPEETSKGPAPEIDYLEAGEAFTRSYRTDAHFAAYSVPGVRRRLRLGAVGLPDVAWRMVLLVVDVDAPGHGEEPTTDEGRAELSARREAWWRDQQPKLRALEAEHPGALMYRSKSGGYRLVWRLAAPVEVRTFDDKEAWHVRYWRELLYLARAFGILGDTSCSDITRLFRLPRVTPEGHTAPLAPELRGDPSALGAWSHVPTDAELMDDRGAAHQLANRRGAGAKEWAKVARCLDPATSEEWVGQGGREPEDQDEARVLKRASAYLEKMPSSIKGSYGTGPLFNAAQAMGRGFALGADTAFALIWREYNPRAVPPWPRADVERACRNATANGTMTWGKLRNADGGEAGLRSKPSERRQRRASTENDRAERMQENMRKRTAKGPRPAQAHDQADDQHGPASSSKDWKADLQTDRAGYRKNLHNVALILANDAGWPGCLVLDDFSGRVTLTRCPPSHVGLKAECYPRPWRDTDDVRVALWLQRAWKIEAGPELVDHAAVGVALENRVHPVRDYLESLTWDGTPRLATWLTTYLGVRNTDYARAVGASMLRAAVARVLRPGCKVDTMLVLQGPQGLFKSTAIKTLCGAEWFTDDLADFGSKDAAMQLRGAWFVEVAELGGMVRAEVERVKSFFSRAVERYRSAYGRHVEAQPRQCVFFGTTNADTYLKDETGNRRFWPVLCGVVGEIDLVAIARDRDQLWAEAVAEVSAGKRWHLDKALDKKALEQAEAAQEAVRERDAWETLIGTFLAEGSAPEWVPPVFVTTGDLLHAVGLDRSKWGLAEQRRVGAIIRGFKWVRRQRGSGTAKVWGYVPPFLAGGHPDDGAPVPEGGEGGGIGSRGGGGRAEKGSGTNGTDRTGPFADVPGEREAHPRSGGEQETNSQNTGSSGSSGSYSQNKQSEQAPIGTDGRGKAPMPPPPATPPGESGRPPENRTRAQA